MKLKIKFPAGAKIKHTENGIEAEYDDKTASKYFEAKLINTKTNTQILIRIIMGEYIRLQTGFTLVR